MEKYLHYIGKDGREYSDTADLAIANGEWMRQNFKFKALDGSEHSDVESLRHANADAMKKLFPKMHENYIRN